MISSHDTDGKVITASCTLLTASPKSDGRCSAAPVAITLHTSSEKIVVPVSTVCASELAGSSWLGESDTVSTKMATFGTSSGQKHVDAAEITDVSQKPVTLQKTGLTNVVTRRVRSQAKPNISKNARTRQLSTSDKSDVAGSSTLTPLQSSSSLLNAAALLKSPTSLTSPVPASASDASMAAEQSDQEPFIPPPCAALTNGHLAPSVSARDDTDDDIADEEIVVATHVDKDELTAEKAAEKMIERKIQVKKKRRQLENLLAPVDRSKVCMRDLIYLNPVNNPMTSPSHTTISTVKTSTSLSAAPSHSVIHSPLAAGHSSTTDPAADDDNKDDDELTAVPQVMVGPDGNIVLNPGTVMIEDKKPVKIETTTEVLDETDTVRRGYVRKIRSRAWTSKETKKFYSLLSRIGTDFSLMCRLFPGRSRPELKRKFKREEKVHHDIVEKVLMNRQGLDITLLAEPSSDEDDVEQTTKRQKRRRKQAATSAAVEGDKERKVDIKPPASVAALSSGGAANQSAATDNKFQAAVRTRKRLQRHLFYDVSSDSENEMENTATCASVQARPPLRPTTVHGPQSSKPLILQSSSSLLQQSSSTTLSARKRSPLRPPSQHSRLDDGHRTIARVPPPDSDDEDEVEVIQAFCGRPTRSGRIPRPAIQPTEKVVIEHFTARGIGALPESTDNANVSRSNSNLLTSDVGRKLTHSTTLSNWSRPVVTLPQVRHAVSLPQSLATRVQQTAHIPVSAGNQSVVATAMPQLDLSHLPPGYFVVVDVPPLSLSAQSDEQRALYHIFAVAQDATQSSAQQAATSVCPQLSPRSAQMLRSARSATGTLASGGAIRPTMASSWPDGGIWNVSSGIPGVQNETVVLDTTVSSVQSVLAEEQPSSTNCDITEICQDLSGIAECELTAMKQEDGTIVIQTSHVPRPRLPQQLVPVRQPTAVKVVPGFTTSSCSQPYAVTHVEPGSAKIVLDTNYGKSSDMVVAEEDDGAQYVDVVVEECDHFEQEEYIV